TQRLRLPQFGMDCCASELERPARTWRQNMRVPTLGFMRTPNVEHALSPAHGQIPRHNMDQSRTAVSWPQFFRMFYRRCHSPLRLNVLVELVRTASGSDRIK